MPPIRAARFAISIDSTIEGGYRYFVEVFVVSNHLLADCLDRNRRGGYWETHTLRGVVSRLFDRNGLPRGLCQADYFFR